jgi:hypothetical protein
MLIFIMKGMAETSQQRDPVEVVSKSIQETRLAEKSR